MSKQRLRYTELAPEGLASMKALEHYLNATSGLGADLLELVRLRVSQMNGCTYCIGMHTHELQKRHEPQSRIEAIAGWRSSDAFTQRERAAFGWAEALTDIQTSHANDAVYAATRTHFEEKELVDLTLAITSINSFNRLAIGFRAEHTEKPKVDPAEDFAAATAAENSQEETLSAVGDDGGKVAED